MAVGVTVDVTVDMGSHRVPPRGPRLGRRTMVGAGGIAAALAVASTTWACTINMAATMTLSPTSASAGDNVTVSTSGHTPLVTFDIFYLNPAGVFSGKECHAEGQNMGNATASAGGSYTKSITIPSGGGTGTAEICDRDQATGTVEGAHAYFTIT